VIGGRQGQGRKEKTCDERAPDEPEPERRPWHSSSEAGRQVDDPRKNVQRCRAEPDEEARFVQSDKRPLGLIEQEQGNASR
jgi:hypothetical protein